jgi:hypothetical protein
MLQSSDESRRENVSACHCEERSDDVSAKAQRAKAEAIQAVSAAAVWIVSLRSQ